MIFTENLSFFYVLVFILLYNALYGLVQKVVWRNILLFVANIVILNTLTTLESLGMLLAINVGVFYAGKALIKNPHLRWIKPTLITLLIGLFVAKNYHIVEIDLLQRVGLSYILFRQIHFILESAKGTIKRLNPLTFINYILFFPTFMAGPIDEYNNFAYWLTNNRFNRNGGLVGKGLTRIFIGVIKKFALVPIIAPYATDFALFDVHYTWQIALCYSMLLYSFYILLDFSGYSDIAIGTAYLMGIKTPENFNNPYIANNLSDFWRRWHMTFSNFLLKYVFKPTVKGLSKLAPSAPRLTVSFAGYIITFAICGIWHGPTLNFLYWGLWHGLFLYCYKLWDKYVLAMPAVGNRSLKAQLFNWTGTLITFVVVTIGWFAFNYDTGTIHGIGKHILTPTVGPITVSNVAVKKVPILKFEAGANALKPIAQLGVEYTELKKGGAYGLEKLQADSNGAYYLATSIATKGLVSGTLQITYADGSEARQHFLTYVWNNQFYPSDVQRFLFGGNKRSTGLNISQEVLNTPVISLGQNFDPRLTMERAFFEKYGFAVHLKYRAMPEAQVEIAYRVNNGEWITANTKRDGKFDFFHIHGSETYNGLSRNMPIGQYDVRIRYVFGSAYSKWFYTKGEVKNYEK
jgi:membrane protein involved in D-alanine export